MECVIQRKISFVAMFCFIISAAFYSFDPLLQSFPSVLTNELMQSFSTSSLGVGLIASSYFYFYNVMQIPAGMLCDRFGIKIVLLVSVVICLSGLLLFSFSHTVWDAVVARMLMGVGASSAASLLVLTCKEYFSVSCFPILVGVAQFLGNIGSISGQLPLAFFAEAYGWRVSVMLLGAVSILIFIFTLLFFETQLRSHENFLTLMKSGLADLKAVCFKKVNCLIAVYAMLLWAPFYTFSSLWGIPYFQENFHISAMAASQLMSIAWLGSGFGSVFIGIWSHRINKRKVCIITSALIGVVTFPLLLIVEHPGLLLFVLLFLFGVASSGQSLSFALLDDHNEHAVMGTAAGYLNTCIMLGALCADLLIGWLIKLHWAGRYHAGVPVYQIADYKISFIIIPLLFLAALSVSFAYKEKGVRYA